MQASLSTRVLKVDASKIGSFIFQDPTKKFLGDWSLQLDQQSQDAQHLEEGARHLQSSDVPVAIPTETVYGLAADATREQAVQGIFRVKGRPADNPLIIHISSIQQLRKLLAHRNDHDSIKASANAIPEIYEPLITRFWPGPLTILLPLPDKSPFARAVSAGLDTVGVRMPSSPLALALLQLAGVPVAAPSANASTRPSTTTATHVLNDLDGRIEIILDGGPCRFGLESTIVNGLSQPPTILRPGAISLQMLRSCPGWQNLKNAYEVTSLIEAPRAPGMKYKHYSPRAALTLFEGQIDVEMLEKWTKLHDTVGVILTSAAGQAQITALRETLSDAQSPSTPSQEDLTKNTTFDSGEEISSERKPRYQNISEQLDCACPIWTVILGPSPAEVAKELFAALRKMDLLGVNAIFVETMDRDNDETTALMNRLGKAAGQNPILKISHSGVQLAAP